MLSKIDHTNVVKLLGYWDKRNNTYLVCEFMEGGSLYSFIEDKTQTISWQQALKLIKDIVNGMIYLHDRNILHLDLKSLNILLSKNKDMAKIADFGLSKISTITSMTAAVSINSAAGSTRWMAPEISQGKPSSRKSDVWSFGCILIEFATRELPFNNMTDKNVFLMLQKDKAEIPLVFDLDKTPSKIAALIASCLKRNKDERHGFASIKERFLDNFSGNELKKPLEHQSNIDRSKTTVVKTLLDLKTKLAESSTMMAKMRMLENELKELKLEKEKQAQNHVCASNNYQQPPCYIRPTSCDFMSYPQPIMEPSCFSNPRPMLDFITPIRRPSNAMSVASQGSYISTGKTYVSNGSANGSGIFRGPRGGEFRISSGGNRVYLKK